MFKRKGSQDLGGPTPQEARANPARRPSPPPSGPPGPPPKPDEEWNDLLGATEALLLACGVDCDVSNIKPHSRKDCSCPVHNPAGFIAIDDTWKLKFRILRQRLLDEIHGTDIVDGLTDGRCWGMGDAIDIVDEMLGQDEEERLK